MFFEIKGHFKRVKVGIILIFLLSKKWIYMQNENREVKVFLLKNSFGFEPKQFEKNWKWSIKILKTIYFKETLSEQTYFFWKKKEEKNYISEDWTFLITSIITYWTFLKITIITLLGYMYGMGTNLSYHSHTNLYIWPAIKRSDTRRRSRTITASKP